MSTAPGATDSSLTTVDWILCILCSGIGCILGIVYMIQGKPKGIKMVGISIAVSVVLGIIQFVLGMLQQGGARP